MNYKLYLLIIPLWLTCFVSAAQNIPPDGSVYRRVRALSDSTYLVQEFDADSVMLFIGALSAVDPDVRNGRFRFYDEKGRVRAVGFYYQDIPYGKWVYYSNKGKIVRVLDYKMVFDFLAKMDEDKDISPVGFFKPAEDQPPCREQGWVKGFSDCMTAGTKGAGQILVNGHDMDRIGNTSPVLDNIHRNIIYPVYAEDKGIAGNVVIRFTLNEDGKVDTAKVLSKTSSDLNMEALRVLLESEGWHHSRPDPGIIPETTFTFTVNFVPCPLTLTQ